MEDVDTQNSTEYDDEAMFMHGVCGDDHELLFLDSYLREAFCGHGRHVPSQDPGL